MREVNDPVVSGVRQDPEVAVRTATVLFTDLRGFSALAEKLADDPVTLLKVVNVHLAGVVRAILKCEGVVEKFVGDGVFVTFGAHEDMPGHGEQALAAALAVVGSNEAMNRRKAAEWGFRLEVGVGMATGKVVVGPIGPAERSELGVLGDVVNIAARLVERAKPGEVLLTASVYAAIADHVRAELVGLSPVRGRTGELEIYRISLLG